MKNFRTIGIFKQKYELLYLTIDDETIIHVADSRNIPGQSTTQQLVGHGLIDQT